MSKRMLALLLFCVGVAVSLVLFFLYDVYAIILAGFVSIEEVLLLVGQTFLVRRLTRPVWKWVTDLLIIRYIGFSAEGRFRKKILNPIWNFNARIYERWLALSLGYRIFAGIVVLALSALVIWAHWRVLLFVPLTASVFKKLDYWTGDRLFDNWTRPFRIRFHTHRFIHENKAARFVLKWPRRGLASLKKSFERHRTERMLRRDKENL